MKNIIYKNTHIFINAHNKLFFFKENIYFLFFFGDLLFLIRWYLS